MAQVVDSDFGEPRFLYCLVKDPPCCCFIDRAFTSFGNKNKLIAGRRIFLFVVSFEGIRKRLRNFYRSAFPIFRRSNFKIHLLLGNVFKLPRYGLRDGNSVLLKVNISPCQSGTFSIPHPGIEENFKHCPVSSGRGGIEELSAFLD